MWDLIDIIGWIAGGLFAFCAFPQALKTYKDGHAYDLSPVTLWMWAVGEVLMIIYTIGDIGFNGPLLFNYTFNLASLVIIMRYKYWPREN